MWEKYANLFTRIDTERDRFLEFERWWNGYYFLSREEILAIVENLFIGNQLEQGLFRICQGCHADLRRIRNPLVIFASYGDNIAPPHQALGWIPAVYKNTEDLKAAGQRIVYLVNPHLGHLGIFVSARVARFEHRAILESLGDVQALKPGLYEMTIDNPSGDPACHEPHYTVRFKQRRVEDLRFEYPRAAFDRVREVSESTESIYRMFVSPWMQAVTNPWTAAMMKWLHPMRTSRYLLSGSFDPWMRGVATAVDSVRANRRPLPEDHPMLRQERELFDYVFHSLERLRQLRDESCERSFSGIYNGGVKTVCPLS